MTLFFVEPQHTILSKLPLALAHRIRWRRASAVAFVTVLVCVVHCLLMLQYSSGAISEPQPALETQPKPLPMIGIVLEAPNGAKAKVKPTETKPALTTPTPKTPKTVKPSPNKNKPKSTVKRKVAKPQEQAAMPQSQDIASPTQRPDVVGSNTDSDSRLSEASVLIPAHASAEYLQNPKPNYPGIARSRHWQGLVELHVYVTPEGLCGELKLLHGSGHDELDEAAMIAVRGWKFVPAKLDDKPVASWVTIPIEFNLQE